MSDSYPESFTIEIEREKLCRYWRWYWLLQLGGVCAFLGSMLGMAWATGPERRDEIESMADVAVALAAGIGTGLVSALLVVGIVYVLFIHRQTKRFVESIEVSVEGPFLRMRQGRLVIRDRKLHFKAIVDYSYIQEPLMRVCGLSGMLLTTTAGGQHSAIRLKGVKDALAVRDMLSEVDRLREDR